jgi:hypothetical protein
MQKQSPKFLRMFLITALSLGGVSGILLFQNCGGFQTPSVDSGASNSASTAEPVSTDSIDFSNITKEFTSRFNATDVTAPDSIFEVKNSQSGRKASVQIVLNATTKKIASVRAIGQPYFCLDPNKSSCDLVKIPAGYNSAGLSQQNCSSPVFFSGALNGSLNDLKTEVICTYPQSRVTITNVNGEAAGTFDATSVAGTDVVHVITNPVTGRKASLRILIKDETRAILSVNSTDQPYFCYEPSQSPCKGVVVPAGYSTSGTIQPNCSSPIAYSGAIAGRVREQSLEVQCPALL